MNSRSFRFAAPAYSGPSVQQGHGFLHIGGGALQGSKERLQFFALQPRAMLQPRKRLLADAHPLSRLLLC